MLNENEIGNELNLNEQCCNNESKILNQLKFISKELIDKGWSSDKKYCITSDDGKKYLLRIIPKEKIANRVDMFYMEQRVEALGVPMCKPLEIGKYDENIYTIQTWINGKDANDVIPFLNEKEQYNYGVETGRILKKIHSIKAPKNQPDWETIYNEKIDRNIKMYNECPVKFDGSDYAIDYIEKNRHLLLGRPQTFQHGDYHIGNLMIENDKLIVIDFNRADFGDPFEEFNRIVWDAKVSNMFATGIINGYFDYEVPEEFWKLLALYLSSNTLGSIAWSIPFGEAEINVIKNQANAVMKWYDNMKRIVPAWYMGANL